MGGSEQRRQGRAFRCAKERRLFHICSVHNCPEVVHTLVEAWKLRDTIGHACPTLVKHCYPSKGSQPQQPPSDFGMLPVDLNVRHEIRSENQINRPVAKYLVSDMDVALFA